jgi:hypothetical protein
MPDGGRVTRRLVTMGLLPSEMSADFTDILLLMNALGIAFLLAVLYMDELSAATSQVVHRLNRLFWFACTRAKTGR